MRKHGFGLALLVLALLPSVEASSFDDGLQRAMAQSELIHLAKITNQFRAQFGLPSLKEDPALSRAAQLHARFMAVTGFFGHQEPGRPRFLTPDRRVQVEGYDWIRVGENICWGFPDSEAALNSWIHSRPHLLNLVNPDFTDIGLGCAEDPILHSRYWVMVLGRRHLPMITGNRPVFSLPFAL